MQEEVKKNIAISYYKTFASPTRFAQTSAAVGSWQALNLLQTNTRADISGTNKYSNSHGFKKKQLLAPLTLSCS